MEQIVLTPIVVAESNTARNCTVCMVKQTFVYNRIMR